MTIGIKNFLCVNGVECVVPHLIDKTNPETVFNWLQLCVYVCDFSLYTQHITLPFFCMLRHIYVNPASIQNPSAVQPRWQWLEFSNESLLLAMPREKPSLRLVSDLWVLVEKLWASATRSFRLALKQSRNKNSKVLCIIDIRVALLLQETLDCSFPGCYFSPVVAVISEFTKTARNGGLQQSLAWSLACCR